MTPADYLENLDQTNHCLELCQELVWRLGFLRTMTEKPDPEPSPEQILDWFSNLSTKPHVLTSPDLNPHFSQLFPLQTKQFGPAFLELDQNSQNTPLCLNHDFFAASLADLGLEVVYFEPERTFYYREPFLNLHKPVTAEKLQSLFRGLVLRASKLLGSVNSKLNIWAEFVSDKQARLVLSRAKSVLAADSGYFSSTSTHTRIRGIELHERVAMRFVDELLVSEPGQILKLHDAYSTFSALVKTHSLEPIKRSDFSALFVPIMRDKFSVALRNDLDLDDKQNVKGWKGVKLRQSLPA